MAARMFLQSLEIANSGWTSENGVGESPRTVVQDRDLGLCGRSTRHGWRGNGVKKFDFAGTRHDHPDQWWMKGGGYPMDNQ
jgi:hypothetical protein